MHVKQIWPAVSRLGKYLLPHLVTAVFSISVSFYLATHLKPHLHAKAARGLVFVGGTEKDPKKFVTAIFDFLEPEPKLFDAHTITFSSQKEFTIDETTTHIFKLVVRNDGWTTAKNIRIGFRFPIGSHDWKLVNSPNIKLKAKETIPASSMASPFMQVEFDRLAPDDEALIIAAYRVDKAPPTVVLPDDTIPFVRKDVSEDDAGIEFLQSEEGVGDFEEVHWDEVERIQKTDFAGLYSGYWASALTVKPGVVPKVEDIDLTVNYSIGDEHGGTVKNGTANFSRKR